MSKSARSKDRPTAWLLKIALSLLLLTTVATAATVGWYWRTRRRMERATIRPQNIEQSRPVFPMTARGTSAAPKVIEIKGIRYASLDEAERQRRLALDNARKGQTNAANVERRIRDLADVLYRQDKFALAEPLYRELLQSRRSRLNPEHNDLLSAANSFGRLLTEWAWNERSTNMAAAYEHAREGEKLLRDVMAIRLEGTNVAAWALANTQSRLGGALVVLAFTDASLIPAARGSMLTNAETLLLQGLAGLEQDRRSELRYKREAIERLVRLYEAWGNPEKLAKWKQTLAAFEQATVRESAGERRYDLIYRP